jgi:hypothetical protein
MKINRLDAHDRLQHYSKQSGDISYQCKSIIDSRPFGDHPFYIFAHTRTIELDEKIGIFNDDIQRSLLDLSHKRQYKSLADIPSKRLIWQPRLTKPKAQTNSMLFKGYPGSDNIKVIWIIPARELWDQYKKGNITESSTILESINAFENNRRSLEAMEEDDLSDEKINAIYKDLSINAQYRKI